MKAGSARPALEYRTRHERDGETGGAASVPADLSYPSGSLCPIPARRWKGPPVKFGHNRPAWRRWSLQLDTDWQGIGRFPADDAVRYVLLPCLVLLHIRPDHYPQVLEDRAEARLRRRRRPIIEHWQRERDSIWANVTYWNDRKIESERLTTAELSLQLATRYDNAAGDARARAGYRTVDGWVPTLAELRIYREPSNTNGRSVPSARVPKASMKWVH